MERDATALETDLERRLDMSERRGQTADQRPRASANYFRVRGYRHSESDRKEIAFDL